MLWLNSAYATQKHWNFFSVGAADALTTPSAWLSRNNRRTMDEGHGTKHMHACLHEGRQGPGQAQPAAPADERMAGGTARQSPTQRPDKTLARNGLGSLLGLLPVHNGMPVCRGALASAAISYLRLFPAQDFSASSPPKKQTNRSVEKKTDFNRIGSQRWESALLRNNG